MWGRARAGVLQPQASEPAAAGGWERQEGRQLQWTRRGPQSLNYVLWDPLQGKCSSRCGRRQGGWNPCIFTSLVSPTLAFSR